MIASFYAGGVAESQMRTIDFYRQDVSALESLGFNIRIDSSLRDVLKPADIYFVWWWTRALPVVLLARLRRRPVVVTGTFNWDSAAGASSYLNRPLFQRAVIRASAKLASQNLFVSERERAAVADGLRLSNDSYYPHSIECLAGCTYVNSGELGADLMGLQVTQPYILNLAWSGRGNLHRKCVYELVEAFEIVADRFPTLELVLAGNAGDGEADLRARARNSPYRDRIRCLGAVAERSKHLLLANATIYASPSRFEGFGLAIAEAAAHGTKVVTSDVGAVREVLGDAGIYCDGTSPASIAQALSMTLGSPSAAVAALDAERFSQRAKQVRLKSILSDIGPVPSDRL